VLKKLKGWVLAGRVWLLIVFLTGCKTRNLENGVGAMKRKHQVWEAACLVCGDVITNPICPECLMQEIRDWLSGVEPEFVQYLKDFVNVLPNTGGQATHCVLCGQNIGVCSYCFAHDVLEYIIQERPDLADSFIENFFGVGSTPGIDADLLAM
jgi:hypothetical protein